MTNRLLLLFLTISLAGKAQNPTASSPGPRLPSPEEFLNQVYHTVVDSSFDHYYLITGADTCRFVKYDYDEWINYYLHENVPIVTLNELSEKAYLSRYPYYWKQQHLDKAICINLAKADSLLFPERYTPIDSVRHRSKKPKPAQSPLTEKLVFSFSLPQFTDDGLYAVIDLNSICGANCGISLTCMFKHKSAGWTLIGRHINYSSLNTTN